jgi:hypothetical protein
MARNDAAAPALWILRIAGGLTLLLSIVMLAVFPAAPETRNVPGFMSPVVGFELASTPQHVFDILGEPGNPARAEAVRKMNLGNQIDFLFMLAYPAIYVGIAWLLLARGRIPLGLARFVTFLAVVMWLGDLLENLQLLRLAELTDPTAMAGPLDRLRQFTFMKWHALFGASAIVAWPIFQDSSWWRWTGLVFGAAAVIGFASVVTVPPIETAAYVLAVGWTATWVYALRA